MRVAAVELSPLAGLGRAAWLVRVTDERGEVGRGEASPLPGYSPDDADACAVALRGIAGELAAGESVEAIAAPAAERLAHVPAARFALDTALCALLARRAGCSIARVLGGERDRPIAVNGVIAGDVATWRAQADALLARGVRTIKVKTTDTPALRALRSSLPADVVLRVDANGRWSLADARAELDALADVAPEYVEEPTRGDALVALGRCAVPWAADESLADPARARALLDADGCAAFVIKPAIVGGLVAARTLALAAQARGKAVAITHMLDGPIARAAAVELAWSLPGPLVACGLDGAPPRAEAA